jgi:GntR family transcriptional repressor for pyruvate dehydrogenase complex
MMKPLAKPSSPSLPKASSVIADSLRNQIVVEQLLPGTALPSEGELIASTGFSRATVREALRLLEVEGLLQVQRGPRGGVRVRYPEFPTVSRSLALLLTISEVPLRSLFELRKLLEPPACALAAQRATRAQKSELMMAADRAATDSIDDKPGFHALIDDCTGNYFLTLLLEVLQDVVNWEVREELFTADDIASTFLAHQRIARAITDGDPERAHRAMLTHLQAFEDRMGEEGRLDQPIIRRSTWARSLAPNR